MAIVLSPSHGADEEDYIDMELTSSPNLFRLPERGSPQTRDFEFQMSSSIVSSGRDSTTSPADELFYKGKLLPLYLPPRLQMVQTLLRSSLNPVSELSKQSPEVEDGDEEDDGKCGIPFISISTAPSTNINTPLDSSPSESCRVSCELNPADYFFEWSNEFSSFINTLPKKSWSKKLKMIRHLSLSQKLKASRTYLKSLFSKSASCSDESSCAKTAARNMDTEKELNKSKDFASKYNKVVGKKSTPFGHVGRGPYPTIASLIKRIDKEGVDDNISSHRRSFSGAIKRHSPSKCLSSSSSTSSSSSGASSSSSSFSVKSNALYESTPFKRSSSDASDIEISIQYIEAVEAHIVGPFWMSCCNLFGHYWQLRSFTFHFLWDIVQLDAIILRNTPGPQGPEPRSH